MRSGNRVAGPPAAVGAPTTSRYSRLGMTSSHERKSTGDGKGLFHCLGDDGRLSYAAAVHRATPPGATLLLSCFSDANPVGEEWRPAVSETTLRDVLGGAGWDRVAGACHDARRTGRRASRNGVLVSPRAKALSDLCGTRRLMTSVFSLELPGIEPVCLLGKMPSGAPSPFRVGPIQSRSLPAVSFSASSR
jgi:hypothetical protein